ncbi:MAG TPA: hypothetical protein VF478_02315 [Anaerolineae bacterium]
MTINKRIVICSTRIAFLGLALVVSACSLITAPPPALTLDALKNAEYTSDLPAAKKAKLTNGVYEEQLGLGASFKLNLRLTDSYALGDLNGDGTADAAVVLAANTGGSGVFITLAAVVNEGGKPRHVASADLGDRTQIKSIAIAGGVIVMDLVTHTPSDPMCCPTQNETQKFRLQGEQLVKVN